MGCHNFNTAIMLCFFACIIARCSAVSSSVCILLGTCTVHWYNILSAQLFLCSKHVPYREQGWFIHSLIQSVTHTKSVYWLITIHFFDVHVTVHLDKFLIIKPTRCTNFSKLFLEWNLTFIGQFPCPSSGVLHCTYSNGICHMCLLTVWKQDAARKLSANLYSTYCCFMYSEDCLIYYSYMMSGSEA